MNIASAIVVYVIWWWIAFLVMLPMGVRGRWEGADDGVAGADPGAPENPELGKKVRRATIAAAGLTLLTCAIIISGVIDFRDR